MQKSNGERDSPWNIPLRILMGCDCITSCLVFKISFLFHFSIDSLQNLTILLFTPTNSIVFSTQLCETLSNAFWFIIIIIIIIIIITLGPHSSLL